MTTKRKVIIAVVVLAVIGIAVYFYMKNKKAKAEAAKKPLPPTPALNPELIKTSQAVTNPNLDVNNTYTTVETRNNI